MKMNLQYFAAAEGYSPNWMNKYEIGVAATVGENGKLVPPTTVHELADGIQEATPSQDESSETYEYYGDKGGSNTDITRVTGVYAFTGHRKYATDAAQEFVRDRLNKAGQDRIVFFRHTEPDGRVIQGNATLSGIVHTGGEPNNRGNFEMQVSFNGVPEDTKPDTTPEG